MRKLLLALGLGVLVVGAVYVFLAPDSSYPHTLQPGETIENWDFAGAYEGNATLEQKARDEMSRLKGLLGIEGDEHTDYSIYVALANQHRLLGDGEAQYANLKKALAIDAEGTGLAWNNLAVLLDQLGAKKSALDAYQHAVRAQGQIIQYQLSSLEYHTEHFPDDDVGIEEAFAAAEQIFGENASLLQIKAEWREARGDIAGALVLWKKIATLVPQSDAIESEIKRLEAR